VLAVVYLIFTEGHTASSGDRLVRDDLCAEAIRLGRLLVELMPDEPEVPGLLALMLLVDGHLADAERRRARLPGAPPADAQPLTDAGAPACGTAPLAPSGTSSASDLSVPRLPSSAVSRPKSSPMFQSTSRRARRPAPGIIARW
jgi:hypothetical protein